MSQTQKRTTHTPGPWRRVTDEDACSVYVYGPVRLDYRHGYNVATVEGNAPWEETQANARLIAAAPGLLAVLEALLDATRAQPWTGVADLDDDWFVSMEQAIDEAKR